MRVYSSPVRQSDLRIHLNWIWGTDIELSFLLPKVDLEIMYLHDPHTQGRIYTPIHVHLWPLSIRVLLRFTFQISC